ncbi:MAG TPA: hypothetical protein VE988_00350 [Gemmataceae bacterium]|nr:hypothetical protein [Gemmataceae bacterium]
MIKSACECGPAPQVPFNRNRFLSTFRWFWDYAGGFLTGWGTHRLDSVRQLMHAGPPISVTGAGGRSDVTDNAQTPVVLQVTYEFRNFILSYESNQLNGHGVGGRTGGRRYYRMQGREQAPAGPERNCHEPFVYIRNCWCGVRFGATDGETSEWSA